MRKIVKYWVKNADDLEIPKDDIIHTERIVNSENEIILEIWALE